VRLDVVPTDLGFVGALHDSPVIEAKRLSPETDPEDRDVAPLGLGDEFNLAPEHACSTSLS